MQIFFQCCGACLILVCLQNDMTIFTNLQQKNQSVPTKMAAIAVLFLMTIYRTNIWHASGFTFWRCCLELLLLFSTTPVYYIMLNLLWTDTLVWSEQLVVFLMPINVPLMLYSSSYTAWTLGVTGILSSVWMMTNKLPMTGFNNDPNHR